MAIFMIISALFYYEILIFTMNGCVTPCSNFSGIGCTDDAGLFHNIGDTWEHATDSCLTCECRSDQNQVCSAKQCGSRSVPVCQDGKEPTAVFDLTGCCASYACDCE